MQASADNSGARGNGFLAALGIFALGVLTYPLILMYSRLLAPGEVVAIYGSPASLVILALLFAGNFLYIRGNYGAIGLYLASPEPGLLDRAQKTLIGFPRRIITMSLVFTVLSFQAVLLFFPGFAGHRLEHLALGFANAAFFGIPMYIVFYQRIERWASPIPHTSKYTALKLSGRISIVVMFSILAVCAFLIITIRETVRLSSGSEGLIAELTARSMPIVAFGFAVGVLNISMIMRGVASRIGAANDFAAQLGEGALRGASFAIVPRDELGTLSNGLNTVRDKISRLILSTKQTVQEAIIAKDQLLVAATTTGEAVSSIGRDVELLNEKFGNLDSRTDEVLRSVESVNLSIEALDGEIGAQATQVEQSTAAVTEMIASFNSISSIAGKKLESTAHLVSSSEDGRKRLDETLSSVRKMDESIGKIVDMVTAIQKIASQTNLLAMNAAIEAAHAGDYGRGFAVVADEIRSLAEVSGKNSKEINSTIKGVIALIRDAAGAGEATAKAFRSMDEEITSVVSSFAEIEGSVSELKVGGGQILDSVATLRDISSRVSGSSRKISAETGSVGAAMAGVKGLFAETRSVTAHMTGKVRTVAECSTDTGRKSRDIDEVTTRISESLAAFRTE